MFDVRDYLGTDPWNALIRMINDRAYVNLNPVTAKLVSLEAVAGPETRVTLDANRSTSDANIDAPLPENLVYLFERLDLSTFFGTTVIDVSGVTLPITSAAIMDQLGERNGIVFDVGDFYQEEYTAFSTTITLRAHPNSLRWIGQLRINLINTVKQNLATLTTKVEFPNAVYYPDGDANKIQGSFYANCFTFDAYREQMKWLTLPGDHLQPAQLVDILRQVTGDPWVCQSTPAPYNVASRQLNGLPWYTVAYAGTPVARFTGRKDVSRLNVLKLDATLCTGVAGVLLLHYS